MPKARRLAVDSGRRFCVSAFLPCLWSNKAQNPLPKCPCLDTVRRYGPVHETQGGVQPQIYKHHEVAYFRITFSFRETKYSYHHLASVYTSQLAYLARAPAAGNSKHVGFGSCRPPCHPPVSRPFLGPSFSWVLVPQFLLVGIETLLKPQIDPAALLRK